MNEEVRLTITGNNVAGNAWCSLGNHVFGCESGPVLALIKEDGSPGEWVCNKCGGEHAPLLVECIERWLEVEVRRHEPKDGPKALGGPGEADPVFGWV
jgi:hypothetical protein